MATMQEFQARMQAAVREAVQKVLAEGDLPEGAEGAALFTVIEDLALAAGDAVSLEVFEQRLAELTAIEQPADCCPQCGRVGRTVKKRSREITTRRGLAVPLAVERRSRPRHRRARTATASSRRGTRIGVGFRARRGRRQIAGLLSQPAHAHELSRLSPAGPAHHQRAH